MVDTFNCGHPKSIENTVDYPSTGQKCKTCMYSAQRRWQAKKKAKCTAVTAEATHERLIPPESQ